MNLAFTVHGKPAPAGSKRAFKHRSTGRVMVVDASKESRPWKAQVADAAAQAMNGGELLRGPLTLELTFWLPRPKGHLSVKGTVKPSAPSAPAVKPDLLKLARGVEDALTGVCYFDDAQIVEERLGKGYTIRGARLEVRLGHPPDLLSDEWPAARSEAA